MRTRVERRERGSWRLALALAFVLASFALNSVQTRFLVSRGLLDPGLATVVRFLAGAASLVVLLAAQGRARELAPGRRNAWPAFWLGAYAFLISYGYVFIGAAAGTFVFYACVLAAMTAGAAILERHAPSRRGVAGGLVALAGVGALALGRTEGATPLGVLLLAGTGASWGAYSALGRRHADALAFTASNFAALALALAPAGVLLLALFDPVITPVGLLVAAFMGAVTTSLSYAVWYWALPRIAPAQAATYQLAIPVLTALMAVAMLGERFTPRIAVAGALVLAGMALATPALALRKRRRAARAADEG